MALFPLFRTVLTVRVSSVAPALVPLRYPSLVLILEAPRAFAVGSVTGIFFFKTWLLLASTRVKIIFLVAGLSPLGYTGKMLTSCLPKLL